MFVWESGEGRGRSDLRWSGWWRAFRTALDGGE